MHENQISQKIIGAALSDKHLGLIINFHVELLRDGIYRVVNLLQEP